MPTPPSPAAHLWALYEAWKVRDERLPLARPPQPALPGSPARPSQAQPAQATRPGPGSTIQPRGPSLPLPLPPVPQPPPTRAAQPQYQLSPSEMIQREPATIVGTLVQRDAAHRASAGRATVVQRDEDEGSESEEELDLAELAERIYPLVKRLLAIERERMPGRSA